MSTAVKALLVCMTLGCSSEMARTMKIDLRAASNVDTTGILGITLYLYGVDCAAGPHCDSMLKMAMHPRGSMLAPFSETRAQPGTYVHIDPSGLGSACGLLYTEAYATQAFPGKTLAAGCADLTLPMEGTAPVVIDMVSTTDADSDGWIGQFNFPDGSHKQGPDCNDNEPTIYPGAAEPECTGDHNCDGRATCTRECQSNADCASQPNNAHCCSFDPSWVCQMCAISTCAESSECLGTHCCNHANSMCTVNLPSTLCNCASTTECRTLGGAQCCISNQNTAGDLTPGTCTDVANYLRTHPSGFFTEWCRCESTAQCDGLFPTLAGQICCVRNRLVCDIPRTGESCL
jgi:hypothetical protein